MLGLIDDISKTVGGGFTNEGDAIYLIGNDRTELGGSEYLKQVHNLVTGVAPVIDIDEEKRLQKTTLSAIRSGLVHSAHDCSEGGLAICLAEKAIMSNNNLGADLFISCELNAGKLFGESQSRIVVSLPQENCQAFEKLCQDNNVRFWEIGEVVKEKFNIEGCLDTTVSRLREEYERVIPEIMG
jgi:phosphoribosylformylglycinamidine synthase